MAIQDKALSVSLILPFLYSKFVSVVYDTRAGKEWKINMKDIMNTKFNFIGDIKFNWINYYDIYKSFITAIKRSRIPNFISENSI